MNTGQTQMKTGVWCVKTLYNNSLLNVCVNKAQRLSLHENTKKKNNKKQITCNMVILSTKTYTIYKRVKTQRG